MLLSDLTKNTDYELIIALHELAHERNAFDSERSQVIQRISSELRDRVLSHLLTQSVPGHGMLDS